MGLQFQAIGEDGRPIYLEGFDILDPDSPRGWFAAYGWNSGNAVAMCDLLGLGDPTFGSVDIYAARRAVLRATALFDSKAPNHTREEERRYGAPSTGSDGVVELRPLRAVSRALTIEDIRQKLTTFAAYVEAAASAGAIRIQWS